MSRESIIREISAERDRQDGIWGGVEDLPPNRTIHKWLSIVTEEVGEAAEAGLDYDDIGVRTELIHVAATALSALEHIDRNGVTFE